VKTAVSRGGITRQRVDSNVFLCSLSTPQPSRTNFKRNLRLQSPHRNRFVPAIRLNWKAATSSPSSTSPFQRTRVRNYRNTLIRSKHRLHEVLLPPKPNPPPRYQNGDLTTGIIFFHSLADDESAGKTTSFRALKELCGEQALRNTVIATTGWVTEPIEARKKQERWEKKLLNTLFASAIAKGARIFRHKENTTEAAQKIVKALLGRPPILVGVQKELADEALRLQRTESGGLFLGDISVEDGNTTQPEMGAHDRSEGTITGVLQTPFIAPRSSRARRDTYVTGAGHRKPTTTTTDHKQKIKRWKRQQEHRARKAAQEKWDPVEMVACVCCGAALYAVLTLFREHGAFVVGL